MRAKSEALALVLGFFGLVGTIAATALPMWRVSAFIGANLIVMEELWEGLWMICYTDVNFRMQCKAYDSLLILPPELQAARGLMCASIVLVVVSLCVTGCGTKRSRCCDDNIKGKNVTLAVGGGLFLLSSVTALIPVSWVGHTVISNFYNPTVVDSQKRELGKALFIGWVTAGVLLISGVVLLFSYSKRRSKEEEPYADTYLLEATDAPNEGSVKLARTSSFYKHNQYV